MNAPQLPRVERDDTGHPVFTHVCDGTERRTILPLSHSEGWWWNGDALRPSIHCSACDTHGWWDGPDGWRPV